MRRNLKARRLPAAWRDTCKPAPERPSSADPASACMAVATLVVALAGQARAPAAPDLLHHGGPVPLLSCPLASGSSAGLRHAASRAWNDRAAQGTAHERAEGAHLRLALQRVWSRQVVYEPAQHLGGSAVRPAAWRAGRAQVRTHEGRFAGGPPVFIPGSLTSADVGH